MKILVTGGAGYIGSVAVKVLLEAGHSVAVFDSLELGHAAAVSAPARLHKGDLADPAALDAVFKQEKPDCVMHFAARSLVAESVEKPGLYFHNNVACGVNLLNACLKHRVRRFVFSSSAAVYGTPAQVPITEDAPLAPINPYGSTKRVFETLLEEYEKTGAFHYASLRYFNVAGAYAGLGEDHRPETHLIPRLLRAAADPDFSFELFGDNYPTRDGTCVRDYIHVHDLARAHLLALEAIADRSWVFNLGSEAGYTNREVIAASERITGQRIRVRVAARRPGDPPALVASSALIRRELGWRPEKSLDEMIADAWSFLCRYPNGYPD